MTSDVDRVLLEEFRDYAARRVAYYNNPRRLLRALLRKDGLIFALRGIDSCDAFVEAAFAAHESSSEEGMLGNMWQAALARLVPNTVGGGDLRTERDGTLWLIQVKSGTEQNSGSEAQDLRILRTKLLQEVDHQPRRKSVQAMLAILRGPREDRIRPYRAKSPANSDLDGFQYRYIVGSAFWDWYGATLDTSGLVSSLAPEITSISAARAGCLDEMKALLRAQLSEAGLGTDMESLLFFLDLTKEERDKQEHKRQR